MNTCALENQIKNFHFRLKDTLTKDRYRLLRELGKLQFLLKRKDEKALQKHLQSFTKRFHQAVKRKKNREDRMPRLVYPLPLPIIEKKDEIITAIQNHQVIVITGETGSGKTTQLPKMCIEAGQGRQGLIGCTQPRRIAAITVAQRVAAELNEGIGLSVGYKIRFEEKSRPQGFIKVMTDGILLMEAQADPLLTDYDTLIIDEAHERSINVDFLLGILKTLLPKRRDLKIIITSATIDPEKFSKAFQNAPIIEVSGRTYPVEVRYSPIDPVLEEKGDVTYINAAVNAVEDLKAARQRGDILIFMPTEQDIRETCDLLLARSFANTLVLPLFARLSSGEQYRVFQPTQEQKVIVATNVAETSLTIPGIRYVIDTGLARISEYSPATRVKRLPVKPISQSSTDQRKGRCGRVQNGICIRLYAEEDYDKRPLFTTPEILRSNLAEVILRMIALRIGDIFAFPFIDSPNPKAIRDALNILQELGAVTLQKNQPALTPTGRRMARLPIDPRIARMVIEAEKEGCVEETIIIASALCIQEVRERPSDKEQEADAMHKPFLNPASDFITFLNIWNAYHDHLDKLKTQNKMRKFCRERFLSYKRMQEWRDIYTQITEIVNSEKPDKIIKSSLEGEALYCGIHKSILSGYLSNIAVRKEKNIYRTAKGGEVMVFPGSGIFNRGGEWIVAAETVETSRLFARTAAQIKSEWLEETGREFCRYTYADPHWEKNRGEVVALEQVTLFGLPIISGRPVSYGRINPEEASEIFIRQALIEGETKTPFPFLLHNRNIIEGIAMMEDKIRRRDILVGEDSLAAFYRDRLGNVYDIRTLKKLIRDKGSSEFLKMTENDVRMYYPAEELLLYPDSINLGNACLPCTYRFNPGKTDDGVTINITNGLATALPLQAIDWHIPGLLREKITALLKGLPKEYRKRLVPLPDTVDMIMKEMPKEEALVSALGKFLYHRFGIDIPATAWPLESLPEHLKMRFALVDDNGREIKAGRDPQILHGGADPRPPSATVQKIKKSWEKTELTAWTFGTLPECIAEKDTGTSIPLFPALEKDNDCVNLRLYESQEEAHKNHLAGVVRLYELHFQKELKFARKNLTLSSAVKSWANYLGGAKHLEEQLYQKTVRTLFEHEIRDEESFFRQAETSRNELFSCAQKLLKETEQILAVYHEVRSALHTLETANGRNKTLLRFLQECRGDIERLMPRNFLDSYTSEQLLNLPRYLKAVVIRAERGISHLEKDQLKVKKILPFTEYRERIEKNLPPYTSQTKRERIETFSWMVEEYKISVFAPEIKTLMPVSSKRLEEQIREIERMI